MVSFLKEKDLILILILCYIAGFIVGEGKGTLRGDSIVFTPLRKGSNYTLEKSKSDWFLASYNTIAEAVVLSLNYSPPYGKISFQLTVKPVMTFFHYCLNDFFSGLFKLNITFFCSVIVELI